ncbi:MAG: peptidoglycan editing factor PgeF [Porticoccaceae bacterium]
MPQSPEDLALIPLQPSWPVPKGVQAYLSTRQGGCSSAPWDTLNLGAHVGDAAQAVQRNREDLLNALAKSGDTQFERQLKAQWLDQEHGTTVVEARGDGEVRRADAAWTRHSGVVCAVMTADCLPILICDRDASVVAAVHAGWRGLAAGVIGSTVTALAVEPQHLLAYLGPVICARCFEVGPEVRERFLEGAKDNVQRAGIAECFQASPARAGHYLADLVKLARGQLLALGVADIYGGEMCTVESPESFYSYRRDGDTGRQAALIYLE